MRRSRTETSSATPSAARPPSATTSCRSAPP
jgi:hypothetical protein